MLHKIFIFFIILIFSCSKSPTPPPPPIEEEEETKTWYDITPNQGNEGDLYHGIYFLNSNVGWIVGTSRRLNGTWAGTVYHTKDGGMFWWSRAEVTTDADLNGVFFFDERNGITMRWNVHLSKNGGSSWFEWKKLSGPIVRDFMFNNKLVGWAACKHQGAIVMNTSDGGLSWNEMEKSRREGVYLSISSPNPNIVYAVGFNSLPTVGIAIRTIDGGNTWEDIVPDSSNIGFSYHSIHFADELHGWIGADYRSIYHTKDGGINWNRQETGQAADAIFDIDSFDASNAIAVTSAGVVLITHDGGESWQAEQVSDHGLAEVFYLNSGIAYVIGNSRVFKAQIRDIN